MKNIDYKSNVTWTTMIIMDLYCILGVVVFVLMSKKWRNFSKIAKWNMLCLIYPWSIIFVLCLAGTFN